MVDAGFSCREIERRLALLGIDRDGIDGILLTHEHGDHIRGVARFSRRNETPVFATPGTLAAAEFPEDVPIEPMAQGVERDLAGFRVESFAVSHDAREPVGFVITDRFGQRIGVASDTGRRPKAWRRLKDLDALVLESNHDVEMLRNGPYPWVLKERVSGPKGHLSNREAADGAAEIAGEKLQWVVLYHLSRTNNQPALALEEMRAALDRVGCRAEVRVSTQSKPTGWIEIDGDYRADRSDRGIERSSGVAV